MRAEPRVLSYDRARSREGARRVTAADRAEMASLAAERAAAETAMRRPVWREARERAEQEAEAAEAAALNRFTYEKAVGLRPRVSLTPPSLKCTAV